MGSGSPYQLRDSVSEWSLRRRRRLAGRLKNACPHILDMDLVDDDAGKPALWHQLAFESPFGTLDWICMRCGLRVPETFVQLARRNLERSFQSDPNGTLKRLMEAQDKTSKLIRKLNRLGGAP